MMAKAKKCEFCHYVQHYPIDLTRPRHNEMCRLRDPNLTFQGDPRCTRCHHREFFRGMESHTANCIILDPTKWSCMVCGGVRGVSGKKNHHRECKVKHIILDKLCYLPLDIVKLINTYVSVSTL